jgi:translation elongation factor EF-1beta
MSEYNVAAEIKIFMEDPSKIRAVTTRLSKFAKVQGTKEEDGPFGIKILRVTLLLKDDEGGMDTLEEKIKELDGVSQIEVENVGRL